VNVSLQNASFSGRNATLDLGAVTNTADGVLDAQDTVEIDIVVVALDDAANAAGVAGSVCVWVQTTGVAASSSCTSISVAEPALTLSLWASAPAGAPLTAGDTVTFAYTVSHAVGSTADASALILSRMFSEDFDLIPGSLNATVAYSFNGSAVIIGLLPLGSSAVVTFTAELGADTPSSSTAKETALLIYNSVRVQPACF
jgi:hypothetical protein